MAIRTTADSVYDLLNDSSLSDTTLTAFITSASAVVDAVYEYDTTMSATQLELIERWLTAHIVASIHIRTATEERIGEAQVRYSGLFGKGLESTPYGQMVLLLDASGLMRKSGKRSVSFYAIPSFE